MDDIELLKRKLEREQRARVEAEELLERKTLEVYYLNKNLEQQVEERTNELRAARDEAVNANQAKGQFLANMSHEIRTPLHGMLGLMEILSKTRLTPSQAEYVEISTQSGNMLLTIINEILDFSKIEAGKFDFEFRDFDPAKCVESLVDVLANEAYKKGLEISLYIDEDLPQFVNGDEARVRQVLLNLIGNAIKFTPEGDISVNVSLDSNSESGARVCFAVKDTGIGIPSTKLDQVLQPFSQADISDRRKYGGSGLGLTISNYIVTQLGAKLEIRSEEAKGSEFSFVLPFGKVKLNDGDGKPRAKKLIGHQVYVAFPNLTVRQDIQRLLNRWGCTGHFFADVQSAIKAISESKSRHRLHLLCDNCGLDSVGADFEDIKASVEDLVLAGRLNLVVLTKPAQKALILERIGSLKAHVLSRPIKKDALFSALKDEKKTAIEQKKDTLKVFNSLKPHILIVEDNDINQQVASAMLNDLGFSFDIAVDGSKAVEMLKSKKHYDLVLMDCQMPVMDGYEASKAIRNLESETKTHIPIVAMTANAFRKTKEKCFESGMDGFLTKPFKQEELGEVILKHLNKLSKVS